MTRHPNTYPDQDQIEVIFHRRIQELTRQNTGDNTSVTYA